jgi:predicted transposase YbfD/YdcC
VAVELGSNEMPKIPALLRHLALQRCVVTVDAIRCQTEIAAQIVAQRADDVLASKANQPTLHEAVMVVFAEARASGFVPGHC